MTRMRYVKMDRIMNHMVCEIRIAVLLRSYLPDITALIICPMTIRDG